MKKILTLLLLLGGMQAYGQIVVETDTITVGNTSGAGGVSLFGKAYLKNIAFGTTHDSVLVRNANGIIRMVPRSSFGTGGAGAYLPLTAGAGSPLTGDVYVNANIGVQGAPTNFGTGYRAVTINGTSGGIFESKSASVTARLAADEGVASGIINVATSHPLQFWTNATNRYEISATGNHDFKNGTATFGGALYGTAAYLSDRLRITGGSDLGSQLNLWADASGNTYLAGYSFSIKNGLNDARNTTFSIHSGGADLQVPLTGTSATFSGNVTVGTGTSGIFIPGTGSGGINLYGAYSGSPSNPGFTITNNAGTVTMSHNSNGGQTNLGGHLVGTSAAFSSNVSSTGSYSTNTALYSPFADINNNANTSTSWENAGLRLTGTTYPGMAFYIPGIYAATISLSPSGILTASTNFHSAGNITASNLNISNWNTAYGWGNHASAGYLTSSSLSSYLALSGGTLSGALGGTSASFSGNITAGGDITANSDARLKKDIRSLGNISEQLRRLNAVSYRMKADNSAHIGFVAQEVEKEFPSLVRKADDAQGTLSVNYQAMTAPLLKGWQEHDAIIQKQAGQIKTQAEQIRAQEERIAQLENALQRLENMLKQAVK